MKKKLLVVSNVAFWGGGEGFIADTITKLSLYYDIHYLVQCPILYEVLPEKGKTLFESKSLLGQYHELNCVIHEIKPELILFNGGSIFYFLPIIGGRKVLYRHSTNMYSPRHLRWLYSIIMNIVYYFADLTIHVSHYSQNEQYLNKRKSICIHNGICIKNQMSFKILHSPLRILYCSRLEESKGIKPIVEAFKSIDKTVAELLVLGTGSLDSWVKNNATENVKIEGFQTDVESYYQQSDAFILMSEYENCPISVLEAMSFSLPIITSGSGGIAEQVIDGYNGIIVPRDVESIKQAVLFLAENREICKKMGENGYSKCIESFNLKSKVEEIHVAIESVINK